LEELLLKGGLFIGYPWGSQVEEEGRRTKESLKLARVIEGVKRCGGFWISLFWDAGVFFPFPLREFYWDLEGRKGIFLLDFWAEYFIKFFWGTN